MLRAYDEQDAASSGAAFSSLDGSNTFAILESYRTDSPEFVPDNQRDLSTDSELVEQFQAELVALTGEPVDIFPVFHLMVAPPSFLLFQRRRNRLL